MSMNRKKNSMGFTLLELIVVCAIMGLIVMIGIGTIGPTASISARAVALYDSSTKIIKNWNVLCVATGTSNTIASNIVPAATYTPLDVMVYGLPRMTTAYQSKWKEVGLLPLTDLVKDTGSGFQILGFPVVLSGGGTVPVSAVFSDVPDEIVLALVTKYGSQVTTLSATGDSTNGVIQYGALDVSATRSVSIIAR